MDRIPNPLPVPTPEQVRATGWIGDVTRYPLTEQGIVTRCKHSGITPAQIPNAAWYYAPNEYVQKQLNGGTT